LRRGKTRFKKNAKAQMRVRRSNLFFEAMGGKEKQKRRTMVGLRKGVRTKNCAWGGEKKNITPGFAGQELQNKKKF